MNFRKLKTFFLLASASGLLLFAQSGCRKSNGIPRPDVSKIDVGDVSIIRFEKELWKADSSDYGQVFGTLKSNYPDFFNLYAGEFLGLNIPPEDSSFVLYDSLFENIISNPWMNNLYDSVENIYSDMSDVQSQIEQAFKYYKYYFPDSTLPKVYTYLGPFVYWTMIGRNMIGLELDMYMGRHFNYYGDFENNMPKYISMRCDKPYMIVNIMRSMMDGNIPQKDTSVTLLDRMITEGKMLYYLDLVLPDVPDSVKIGFTAKQLNWCKQNESDIWKYFAGEDLLFSTHAYDQSRYVEEAPNTPGMPEDSPGRTAVWVGWQIIRDYMHKNKNTTLPQLFNNTDGLGILKASGYEPDKD